MEAVLPGSRGGEVSKGVTDQCRLRSGERGVSCGGPRATMAVGVLVLEGGTRLVVLRKLVVLTLCLTPVAALAGGSPVRREIRFGVQVAQRGLWREARFRFEKALLADPKDAAAHNNLAIALEQEGDFPRARQEYEKALELKPGDLSIQQNYDLFREADEKRNRKQKKR